MGFTKPPHFSQITASLVDPIVAVICVEAELNEAAIAVEQDCMLSVHAFFIFPIAAAISFAAVFLLSVKAASVFSVKTFLAFSRPVTISFEVDAMLSVNVFF